MYVITATFQGNTYVACYTAFEPPFGEQIDVARMGFRRHDGTHSIVLFPSMAKALEWGELWFARNKRVKPALTKQFFSAVQVTVAPA